ncbi:methyltransferase [Alphaproteobacteria bacterium]|jgi:protein-L-isoaspartate(D-aspartate) O-methyltransferase|nr:methyltransferase [Alphaproteobacteria bacterium]
MNLEKNREVMIENQLRPNKITNSDVLQAFMNTSKEQFISEDKINICYSDQDIFIKDRRGYLKNLHLAQILHFADIKNDEKVLHIGGLTGYLSVLISKLCNKIYVTDNDQSFVDKIIKNFSNNEVTNGKVFMEEFSEGLKSEGLYDLIVIDCPQYNFNLNLLNQVNVGGRIIYIEKINEELSKAYKMIKFDDNYSKVFLFDVFSNFYLTKQEEGFNF